MTDTRITIKYILVGVVAVITTWLIHEFAHWLTSESFGYDTIMRLNGTSVEHGEYTTEWHRTIVSATGPLATVLQAVIIFLLLKSQNWNKYLYPFLFTTFYMWLLAGIMNFVNLNDEGRISASLEIGTFTFPIVVSGILFLMIYGISQRHNLHWKFQFATTLLVMVASSVLILLDQFVGIRIL